MVILLNEKACITSMFWRINIMQTVLKLLKHLNSLVSLICFNLSYFLEGLYQLIWKIIKKSLVLNHEQRALFKRISINNQRVNINTHLVAIPRTVAHSCHLVNSRSNLAKLGQLPVLCCLLPLRQNLRQDLFRWKWSKISILIMNRNT